MLFPRSYSPITVFVLAAVCLADPTIMPDASNKACPVRQILELPAPSWLENLAMRPNGEILATRVDKPELYLVNPRTGSYSVIATFDGVDSVGGIAEYAPDVYAVSVGNFTIETLESWPATFSLRTVDLSRPDSIGADGRVAASRVRLLADVPEAHNLNGLTFRPPHTLYSSDPYAGKIWEVDVRTGAYRAAVEDEPALVGGTALPLGVNGLRWSERERALFFTNTDQMLAGVLKLRRDGDGEDGSGSGGGDFSPAETIATDPAGHPHVSTYDDFALDGEGNMYVVTSLGNTVNFVARDGSQQFIIAGSKDSTEIEGPTSAQFGRTPADKKTLYVVTNGGFIAPINGTVRTGAKVVAIDCDGLIGIGKGTWDKQDL